MTGQATLRARRGACATTAFTLIELLVVVAIIALLISILLPSLKRAKEQAKMVACLANLKALGASSFTYSEGDRQNMAIPVHRDEGVPQSDFIGAYEYGGKAGQGEPSAGNDPASSRWGTQRGRGPGQRPLNSVIYKTGLRDYIDDPGANNANWIADTTLDLNLFRCPSDRGYQGLHYIPWRNSGMSSYDHYGTSYAANIFWIGVIGGQCTMRSNSPYLRPMARVPNPANTIYFEENASRFGWMRDPDPCPIVSGGVTGRTKGWHGKWWTTQIVYCDGHAGTIEVNGYKSPHLSSYPSGTDWDTWRCVIVRGQDWQKDTLPSPDIATVHPCPAEGRPSQEGPFGVDE